jgi:LPS-assembly protein
MAPSDWFTFTPLAGGRVTHYTRSPDIWAASPVNSFRPSEPLPTQISTGEVDRGSLSRVMGEFGFDAMLRSAGTFDYRNERWKIDGLRHLFTPHLAYRHISLTGSSRTLPVSIDREVFSTYLPPLGLGDARNIDDLHATNTLRLGFDNLLQTRDPVHGSRDLVVLNVANDFRFKRRPGERDVSEIHAELAVMPAPWIQFDLYQSFAPQDFSLRELNSGVTLKDGRWWSLRFGNNFLRNELQDYSLDARARINERFDVLTRLRYDERRHRFNEQAYGVVQNLGNTWLISYTVSLYSGRRRESSFGFNVQIDTVRF